MNKKRQVVDSKPKNVPLTEQQSKTLDFLKGEMQQAEGKRNTHNESIIKFLNLCAIELKIPRNWMFDEKSNSFIPPKP